MSSTPSFKVPVCLCDSVQTEIFEKKRRLTDNSEKHLLNVRQKNNHQKRRDVSHNRETTESGSPHCLCNLETNMVDGTR